LNFMFDMLAFFDEHDTYCTLPNFLTISP
jgi:hypothetical protein